MAKGESSRRKSIAVTVQNAFKPARKRRAHSIVPGERLSPASKARRLLVPRKSILKATFSAPEPTPSPPDDDNATQSMDITRADFRTEIQDTHSRKSLGRRVSFAEHAHVRMFEIQEHNTNSTGSPQSSPARIDSSPEKGNAPAQVNDENAYPGAFRRRGSIRRSLGEESMELDLDDTAPSPAAFLGASVPQDDEISGDEEDDMEMTNVLAGSIIRRRSSVGRRSSIAPTNRAPLAVVPSHQEQDGRGVDHQEESFQEDDGNTQSTQYSENVTQDHTQPMEFTIPLAQSLRPPEKNDAWLALRAVTHSGDQPYTSNEEDNTGEQRMELDDAVRRLQAARESSGIGNSDPGFQEEEYHEESFTSTDDSLGSVDGGDQTMNVTGVLNHGDYGTLHRMSMEPEDNETMEMTSVLYGKGDSINHIIESAGASPPEPEIVEPIFAQVSAPTSTPNPSLLPVFQPPPSVFTAKPPSKPLAAPSSPSKSASSGLHPPSATVPKPFQFSFTPKSASSQVKLGAPRASTTNIRPSAAFAPPTTRPSPKKRAATPDQDAVDGDKPSPAKKLAIAGPSSQPTARPVSPVKKVALSASSAPSPVKGPTKSLRRPSGYFAKRKSLVGGPTNTGVKVGREATSPRKAGRASLAAPGTSDAWQRFDPSQKLDDSTLAITRDKGKGKGKGKAIQNDHQSVRSASTTWALASPIYEDVDDNTDPPISEETTIEISEQTGRDNDVDVELENQENQEMMVQWREEVQEQSFLEDDGPSISIDQFFNMTGIRFMDEITAPRRSTVHPSQLRTRARAHSPSSTPPLPIPLADYVVAVSVDVPQLELFTHVSKDLQTWIEQNRAICAQANEDALKITPELFWEYSMADEEGRAELLHQLKLIKANKHGSAKGDWYDWKIQWMERLYETAKKGFSDLENDANAIEEIANRAQELTPTLQEEYEQVMRELEEEQKLVAEIEESDQDYLNELKASIAEQGLEVEALRAEVAEGNAKFERLQETLQEIEAESLEVTTAISRSRELINLKNNSTVSEIMRKKDELEALEDLHMWRAIKVRPDLFEFIYASRYTVSIPCLEFKPLLDKVDIRKPDGIRNVVKDAFPQFTELVLRNAKHRIVSTSGEISIRKIIQRLRDYWSSCDQLRVQLKLLAIKYPVSIQTSSENSVGFKATAAVMFPKSKSKAFISYIFDTDTFSCWPMSIESVQCEVEVAYGTISRENILAAVTQRMKQAVPEDNHGCLLDACIEAMEATD